MLAKIAVLFLANAGLVYVYGCKQDMCESTHIVDKSDFVNLIKPLAKENAITKEKVMLGQQLFAHETICPIDPANNHEQREDLAKDYRINQTMHERFSDNIYDKIAKRKRFAGAPKLSSYHLRPIPF